MSPSWRFSLPCPIKRLDEKGMLIKIAPSARTVAKRQFSNDRFLALDCLGEVCISLSNGASLEPIKIQLKATTSARLKSRSCSYNFGKMFYINVKSRLLYRSSQIKNSKNEKAYIFVNHRFESSILYFHNKLS